MFLKSFLRLKKVSELLGSMPGQDELARSDTKISSLNIVRLTFTTTAKTVRVNGELVSIEVCLTLKL
jgi:hypothetical protein